MSACGRLASLCRITPNFSIGWISAFAKISPRLKTSTRTGCGCNGGDLYAGSRNTPLHSIVLTGRHHFGWILLEEVLRQQSEAVRTFLLHSSILDQMCGPLCDAVLPNSAASGQDALAYLQRANLFLIPLDNERRWYRYHHLFADVLRQRADISLERGSVAELHARASIWYETNGYEAKHFIMLSPPRIWSGQRIWRSWHGKAWTAHSS